MAYLLVLQSTCSNSEVPLSWFDTVTTLKYMINMQSHGISYNLGIIALAIASAITLPVAWAITVEFLSNIPRNGVYE